MNPHFQACGRGTGQLCLPYPHPDMAEANVCFQASSKHPEVRLRKVLPVPYKYSGKCHTLRHQNTAMGAAHSQLEAHVSSPIPDTHFAHQLTVLLHTRGQPFLLVHATYKIGTFQRKPARSHMQTAQLWPALCSAYAHYSRAYLTSTISATLASLLFLNTAQLPQAAITH